jgi:hypothetical protein
VRADVDARDAQEAAGQREHARSERGVQARSAQRPERRGRGRQRGARAQQRRERALERA